MRTRRITVAAGGETETNIAEGGPVNAYLLSGTLTEVRDDRADDVMMARDDVHEMLPGVRFYWRNDGTEEAVLIVSDIAAFDR